jgi:alpha-tubulin suppressor-like RCC1 family protein
LTKARSIAAGQAHAVALMAGALYGWGSNTDGQIGAAAREQLLPVELLVVSATNGGRNV